MFLVKIETGEIVNFNFVTMVRTWEDRDFESREITYRVVAETDTDTDFTIREFKKYGEAEELVDEILFAWKNGERIFDANKFKVRGAY